MRPSGARPFCDALAPLAASSSPPALLNPSTGKGRGWWMVLGHLAVDADVLLFLQVEEGIHRSGPAMC